MQAWKPSEAGSVRPGWVTSPRLQSQPLSRSSSECGGTYPLQPGPGLFRGLDSTLRAAVSQTYLVSRYSQTSVLKSLPS